MTKFGANGEASQPCRDLKDLREINPDFTEDSEDQIDIDLNFLSQNINFRQKGQNKGKNNSLKI